jgi:polysaccharide export outer membrane protein
MRITIVPAMLAILPCVLLGAEESQPSPTAAAVTPAVPVSDPAQLAKPNTAQREKILGGAPIDSNTYIVGAEDVLAISVWHEPELTKQVVVRPDGKITLPLVNELPAAGLTVAQLSVSISQALLKYMNAPEVNVEVQQVNSKKYYIQGEVLKPGSFPLVVPTTVMEGLANAGGFKDFANTKRIAILRGTDRLKFNYREVRNGKRLEQNILLQPGDQIIVP